MAGMDSGLRRRGEMVGQGDLGVLTVNFFWCDRTKNSLMARFRAKAAIHQPDSHANLPC